MADGLPPLLPLMAAVLAPRRRPDWRGAGPVRVSARGVWLDPARVDAFLRVCGGCEPPQLPLTFPYALLTPLHLAVLAEPAFPLRPLGLVHREEHIVRTRTLAVGTRIDVEVEARDFRELPSGVAFDLRTTVSQGGEVVWSSRGTMVRRSGRRPPGAPRADAVAEGRSVVLEVPRGAGRTYGVVSRNLDPIHTSGVLARLMGHRRALVHGMWTAARCVAEIGEPTGAATLDLRFRAPLFVPDRGRLVWRPEPDGSVFSVWGTDDRLVLQGRLGAAAGLAGGDASGQATVRSMRR